jgi:hypothetical protein
MKKLLIILAACTLMVSCKWWHETFSSPEKCAQWYCEEKLDALKDGDVAEALELEQDSEKWYQSLSKEDRERAKKAIKAWRKLHAKEIERYDF